MCIRRIWAGAAAIGFLTFGIVSSTTFASGVIGNVARPVAAGQLSLGLDYEDFKQEVKEDGKLTCSPCSPSSVTSSDSEKIEFSAPSLVATYGIPGKPIEIGGLVGNVTLKPESGPNLTGTKAGGFVRYARENPDSVNFGLLLKYEGGSLSSSNYTGSYSATTVAFGLSKDVNPAVRFFGGAFGNQIAGSFDATSDYRHQVDLAAGVPQGTVTSINLKISEKSSLGGFLGAEFMLEKDLVVGAELHAVNESGFGIYARLAGFVPFAVEIRGRRLTWGLPGFGQGCHVLGVVQGAERCNEVG